MQKWSKIGVKGMLMACAGGALALALAAAPALADDQGGMGMPSTGASKTVHASVTVTAVDKSARMLTVKDESGDSHDIQVPADVKSFDKVKKGDKIDIDYTESVALSMLPPGTKPTATEKEAVARTGKGVGGAGKTVTISAEVLEVDAANNKVILKGPKGNARVINVENPAVQAKLPQIKPGQVVQVTYTEAIALALVPKK